MRRWKRSLKMHVPKGGGVGNAGLIGKSVPRQFPEYRASGFVGFRELTSNDSFWAGVCDTAGITAIVKVSINARRFINSPETCAIQCDSEVRVVGNYKHSLYRRRKFRVWDASQPLHSKSQDSGLKSATR